MSTSAWKAFNNRTFYVASIDGHHCTIRRPFKEDFLWTVAIPGDQFWLDWGYVRTLADAKKAITAKLAP